MKYLIVKILILMLLLGGVDSLTGQETLSLREQLDCLSAQWYGSSAMLVNGRTYRPEHPRATGHPYYQNDHFQEASVFIKGREFDQVKVLYNIERDQLILKHQLTNNNMVQIKLNDEMVDSFSLNEQIFINDKLGPPSGNQFGYIKKLYKGEWQLYVKLEKDFYPLYSDKHPRGRYGKTVLTYYLIDPEGKMEKVKNKRSFLKFFGVNKKAVRRFMKKNKIRFNKASDIQWYEIMQFCETLGK